MIHQVSSINMMPGKDKEAEQVMVKIAAIVNQKYPASNSHIVRNLDGKGNQIHIIDTWEVARDAVESDPTWQALIQEGAGLFDENSIERHFYQIVSES